MPFFSAPAFLFLPRALPTRGPFGSTRSPSLPRYVLLSSAGRRRKAHQIQMRSSVPEGKGRVSHSHLLHVGVKGGLDNGCPTIQIPWRLEHDRHHIATTISMDSLLASQWEASFFFGECEPVQLRALLVHTKPSI